MGACAALTQACNRDGASASQAPVQRTATLSADAAAVRAEVHGLLKNGEPGLRAKTLPGGAKQVDLDGHFASAAVARVGADGQVETECFDEAAPAVDFMQGGHAVGEELK